MIRRRHLLLALGVALAALGWSNRAHLQAFPQILPAYSAKEYCSCRYVMANPAAYCAAYVEQYLPLGELVEDPVRRSVTARGLGSSQTAQWLGPRQGCRLRAEAP